MPKVKTDDLRKMQKIELRIMSEIDSFCKKNHLKYSLFYGTAIGAVRHGGFIPWDDDIDIVMERDDYERFIDLWRKNPPAGFRLQDTRPDSKTTLNHSKIFRVGTEDILKKYNVFVDIFPFDKIPNSPARESLIRNIARINILYTRNYPYEKGGRPLKLLSKILLALPRSLKNTIKTHTGAYITKYHALRKDFHYVGFSCPQLLHKSFNENFFQNLKKHRFEDCAFLLTSEYDSSLREVYGDYMKLPPKEERICSHQN